MMKRIEATMGTFGRPNRRVTHPDLFFSFFLFCENVMSCSCADASSRWCTRKLCERTEDRRIWKKENRRSISSRSRGEIESTNGRRGWFTTTIIFTAARRKFRASLGVVLHTRAISSGSSSSGRGRGCQIRRLCGMGICIALCVRYYTSQLRGTMPLFPPYEWHADVSRYHCTVAE